MVMASLAVHPLPCTRTCTGGNYTISFSAITANTYTLQAVATGTQTKDMAVCLTYTINDEGARTAADSTGCRR